MQRIGFDRVNLGAAAASNVGCNETEQQTAEARNNERTRRIEESPARKSFAGIEAEEDLVHETDHFAHRDDNQACDRADNQGEHDHTRLPRADNGAQAVRYFELTAEQAHGQRFNQAGMTNGLNAMALAGARDGFTPFDAAGDCRREPYSHDLAHKRISPKMR